MNNVRNRISKTIKMTGVALAISSVSALADFQSTRTYELSRKECTLVLSQVKAGYESKVNVILSNYKTVPRDEFGSFGDPIYFTKLQGLGLNVKRAEGMQTTYKLFVSELSSDAGASSKLTSYLLDAKTKNRVDGAGILVLSLASAEGSAQKYDVSISHKTDARSELLFVGEMTCKEVAHQ